MKDATPRPPKKAAEKSGRSRAREFALQALYQHLVGHNESAAIDAFTRDLSGFNKADNAHGCGRTSRRPSWAGGG